MFRCALIAAAALVCASAGLSGAAAQDRVALVIGNDRYPSLPADKQLAKAVNDARTVGDALRKLGYKVIAGENLTRQETVDKLFAFTREIKPGDTAVLFFAGHGVAIAGGNYLLPSDVRPAAPGEEARVRNMALGEADIVADIQERKARVVVLVLDACRDNPFKQPGVLRSAGTDRGLARMHEAAGVFAIYSAGFGQSALDSLGPDDRSPNSVFTRVLAPALARTDAHLGDLVIDVREEVAKLARSIGHLQSPAYYDQTQGGRVYLAARARAVEPATRVAPQGQAPGAPPPPPGSVAALPQAGDSPPQPQQPAGPRAWLGVRIQAVTAELAETLNIKPARGALVAAVDDKGPGKPAGLEAGDVIVKFDGREINELRDLPRIVGELPIGKSVQVVVVRNGKEETRTVRLDRLAPAERQAVVPQAPADDRPNTPAVGGAESRDVQASAKKAFGLDLADLDAGSRARFKIAGSVAGLVITKVDESSAGAEKKLKPGDVVVEVAQEKISSTAEFHKRIEQMKRDGRRSALMLIAAPDGGLRFIAMPLQ